MVCTQQVLHWTLLSAAGLITGLRLLEKSRVLGFLPLYVFTFLAVFLFMRTVTASTRQKETPWTILIEDLLRIRSDAAGMTLREETHAVVQAWLYFRGIFDDTSDTSDASDTSDTSDTSDQNMEEDANKAQEEEEEEEVDVDVTTVQTAPVFEDEAASVTEEGIDEDEATSASATEEGIDEDEATSASVAEEGIDEDETVLGTEEDFGEAGTGEASDVSSCSTTLSEDDVGDALITQTLIEAARVKEEDGENRDDADAEE